LPDPSRRAILITRPEPGASESAARLAALSFRSVLAPVLTIRALPTRLPDPARVQAILAASGNAIAGLPENFRTLPLLAVGAATAARARAAGFTSVTSAEGDAAALAALTAAQCRPQAGPLLLVAGRDQGKDLAASLRAQKFRVLRRVVYTTEPVRALPEAAIAALRAEKISAALFFSAATAHVFVRLATNAGLARHLTGVDAISIGQPAAVALKALPWRRIRVAARPNQDAMLAMLS